MSRRKRRGHEHAPAGSETPVPETAPEEEVRFVDEAAPSSAPGGHGEAAASIESEPHAVDEAPREAEAAAETPAARAPAAALAELEDRLARLQTEAADARDRLLRIAADFDNYKKRTIKERSEAARFAHEPLCRDLIPVIDNLERALSAAAAASLPDSAKPIVEGVALVERQLTGALERFGIKRFSALRQPFDPTLHEAIQEMETPDQAPGTVTHEVQRGYVYHERLLRPAMVVLAKTPAAASGEETDRAAEQTGGPGEAPASAKVSAAAPLDNGLSAEPPAPDAGNRRQETAAS